MPRAAAITCSQKDYAVRFMKAESFPNDAISPCSPRVTRRNGCARARVPPDCFSPLPVLFEFHDGSRLQR